MYFPPRSGNDNGGGGGGELGFSTDFALTPESGKAVKIGSGLTHSYRWTPNFPLSFGPYEYYLTGIFQLTLAEEEETRFENVDELLAYSGFQAMIPCFADGDSIIFSWEYASFETYSSQGQFTELDGGLSESKANPYVLNNGKLNFFDDIEFSSYNFSPDQNPKIIAAANGNVGIYPITPIRTLELSKNVLPSEAVAEIEIPRSNDYEAYTKAYAPNIFIGFISFSNGLTKVEIYVATGPSGPIVIDKSSIIQESTGPKFTFRWAIVENKLKLYATRVAGSPTSGVQVRAQLWTS